MSELDQAFEQAKKDIETLISANDKALLLKFYSLFKQASVGDVSGKRPGMMNMVARAKYDAWAEHKGMSSDTAKQQYIDAVNALKS